MGRGDSGGVWTALASKQASAERIVAPNEDDAAVAAAVDCACEDLRRFLARWRMASSTTASAQHRNRTLAERIRTLRVCQPHLASLERGEGRRSDSCNRCLLSASKTKSRIPNYTNLRNKADILSWNNSN